MGGTGPLRDGVWEEAGRDIQIDGGFNTGLFHKCSFECLVVLIFYSIGFEAYLL